MNFRLYRSRDRVVAGVAGGVADALDVDPSIVRIVWALAMFAGLPLLLYIVMAIVVPEEPDDWEPWTDRYGTSRPGAPRTTPPGAYPATPEPSTWTPAGSPGPGAVDQAASAAASDAATATGGAATFDTELNPSATAAPGSGPGPDAATSTATPGAGAGAGFASPSDSAGWSAAPTPAPGHDSWRASHWAEREARRAQRRAERWERRAERRNGSGAIVFGLILIVLGAGFLARQLVPNRDWDQIWPVGLIAIGVLLLAGAIVRRPQE